MLYLKALFVFNLSQSTNNIFIFYKNIFYENIEDEIRKKYLKNKPMAQAFQRI